MIRVDRDPDKCPPLTTEPGRGEPNADRQAAAFRRQLDACIDTGAIERLSPAELDRVDAILGKVR